MYESPHTRRIQVNLEQGFMQPSVVDKNPNRDNPVDAGDQEIEGDFDFTNNNWE